ncbi:MucR family transcriptional regulator [Sphingomonas jatrophae]|uniref:Transcriptional regulator, MucR family n=1 Tax=Sphingomonas jatrophae TaxID=1166337 RepID=A0A1I6M0S8_9SPHN|nr:MucR family transcriptional regulator [Sphingomonas jatrophae]SFS09234.1 transcriptional regulator, MucR family [Sphingomonas jatrophae]
MEADLKTLTADIVTAHLANNEVAAADIASLITSVHDALAGLGQEATGPEVPFPIKVEGKVSVRKSLADPDKIISMIDGKGYSSLKRHLTSNGYTPETYRAAFGLKADYPMVAPGYSERRREVAKTLGLGKRKAAPEAAEQPSKGRRTLKAAFGKAREHLGTAE